jgi:hypothetical protein
MKKVLTAFLLIIIYSTQYPVIFASLNEQAIQPDIEKRLVEIFDERTAVWNDFLEGNYTSAEELMERLGKFSLEPLISDDKEMFKQLRENPASYEGIKGFDIVDERIVSSDENYLGVKAEIIWEVGDISTSSIEKAYYFIELKKVSGHWLLMDYNITD